VTASADTLPPRLPPALHLFRVIAPVHTERLWVGAMMFRGWPETC
jgi:hypothetical protein